MKTGKTDKVLTFNEVEHRLWHFELELRDPELDPKWRPVLKEQVDHYFQAVQLMNPTWKDYCQTSR